MQGFKFNSCMTLSISFAHRRADSGCPCKAPFTGRTKSSGSGSRSGYLRAYHSLNGLSVLTNKGAFGAGIVNGIFLVYEC